MTDAAYHRDGFLTELATTVVTVGEEEGRPFAVVASAGSRPRAGPLLLHGPVSPAGPSGTVSAGPSSPS